MSFGLHKRWLSYPIAALIVSIAVWAIVPTERKEIRYRAATKEESSAIGWPPSRRILSNGGGTGFASDGSWFQIVGSTLVLRSLPTGPPETTLTVPAGLLDSSGWKVIVSPDGKHVVVNTRNHVALLDSLTLEDVWTSPCPAGLCHIAFRQDGAELAATWISHGVVTTAGLKVWETATGTVLLDVPKFAGDRTTCEVGWDKNGAIWLSGSHGRSMFVPVR